MSTTHFFEQDGNSNEFLRREGDPIEGFLLLENYTPIANTTALEDAGNRFNVCQRTGFKVKPGSLKRSWDGSMVRAASYEARNEQDFIRNKAESLTGAIRPEPPDVFLVELGFLLTTDIPVHRILLNNGGAIILGGS